RRSDVFQMVAPVPHRGPTAGLGFQLQYSPGLLVRYEPHEQLGHGCVPSRRLLDAQSSLHTVDAHASHQTDQRARQAMAAVLWRPWSKNRPEWIIRHAWK